MKKEKYDKYGTVDENEFDFEEFMKEFNEGIFGDIFSGIDEEVNCLILELNFNNSLKTYFPFLPNLPKSPKNKIDKKRKRK